MSCYTGSLTNLGHFTGSEDFSFFLNLSLFVTFLLIHLSLQGTTISLHVITDRLRHWIHLVDTFKSKLQEHDLDTSDQRERERERERERDFSLSKSLPYGYLTTGETRGPTRDNFTSNRTIQGTYSTAKWTGKMILKLLFKCFFPRIRACDL